MGDRDLSEAVVLYLGYGSAFPRRRSAPVRKKFGLLKGAWLARRAKAIDRIAAATKVDWNEIGLAEAADAARNHVADRVPSLSQEALEAVGWAFSYDSK